MRNEPHISGIANGTSSCSLQLPTGPAPKREALACTSGRYGNMDQDRIVAVGLLTEEDLTLLGPTFTRLWPVEDAPDFDHLLRAIDEAEHEIMTSKNRGAHLPS